MAYFGPSGNEDAFYQAGYKSSTQMPEYASKLGLDAYEYIRIKILSVWGYAQYVFLYEWTLYGDDGNGPKPEEPGEGEGTDPDAGEGE